MMLSFNQEDRTMIIVVMMVGTTISNEYKHAHSRTTGGIVALLVYCYETRESLLLFELFDAVFARSWSKKKSIELRIQNEG